MQTGFATSPGAPSRIPKPPLNRREILMSRFLTPLDARDEDLGLFKRAFVPESSRTSPVSPEPSDDTWLYKQSSQIRQLEDKLSTYRGLVLGWKHRCDVAEDALEKRIEDRECVGNNVQMLEAKLECIQELLRSQNAHFRQREDRFEWMSSLALLMSCLSIGFILIRLSDK